MARRVNELAEGGAGMGRTGSERPGARVVAVGLTGGMGAGKSTALAMLRELGACTFSADDVVHRLYEDPEVGAALRGRFGGSVVDGAGAIDRRALAGLVAADDSALAWLEAFIHPRVTSEIQRMLAQCDVGTVAVCEVPLLFETGLEELFDLTVTVEAPGDLRQDRNAGRMGAAVWQTLEGRQLTSGQRVDRADLSFVNDGDQPALRAFVGRVLERACAIAGGEDHRLLEVGRGD